MGRAAFLSLDGLDGSGKSTQCRLLADWLRTQGHTVTLCYEPGSTALGEQLRAIVLQHQVCLPAEALLFMASRAQLLDEVIRPALAEGQTIVCDRFELSTIVYQGHAGGLDVDHLWEIGRFITQAVVPDLTFLLDMPPSAATGRIQRELDRMEQHGDDFRERLRAGFLAEAAAQSDRIVIINANQPIETVQAEIQTAAQKLLR